MLLRGCCVSCLLHRQYLPCELVHRLYRVVTSRRRTVSLHVRVQRQVTEMKTTAKIMITFHQINQISKFKWFACICSIQWRNWLKRVNRFARAAQGIGRMATIISQAARLLFRVLISFLRILSNEKMNISISYFMFREMCYRQSLPILCFITAAFPVPPLRWAKKSISSYILLDGWSPPSPIHSNTCTRSSPNRLADQC